MLNQASDKLIGQLKRSDVKVYYSAQSCPKIEVDSFVSKIANIYEKIRNAIDYKEDHLIRKSAILRILQRHLLIKLTPDSVAMALIKELIRAGYLENSLIPYQKVDEVQAILERYLAVFNFSAVIIAVAVRISD